MNIHSIKLNESQCRTLADCPNLGCQTIEECPNDDDICTISGTDLFNHEEACRNTDNKITFAHKIMCDGGLNCETPCTIDGYILEGEDQETLITHQTCYSAVDDDSVPQEITYVTCLDPNNYVFLDPTLDYDPKNWYIGDNFYCGPCLNKEEVNILTSDGKKCCNRLDFDERGDLKGDCIPCEITCDKGKQWWRLS